ncbi:hypothetical protein KTS45_15595 [Halomicroarcula limicola]|uniref:Uncharacterized protein n=1 Tax=Haloarcula limicola TaxID=1429915 RepID=A0A8J7YCA4_9EURY|nr:hypothetical protein [Halomicroarcula limicola]MBV0925629.1 hypothetical protein [Halomicroarcula limicola]
MDPALATVLVVITSAVVLVLGGVVTHLAYRAARRSGSPVMRRFAVGFGLVTLGLLLGGGVHQMLGWGFLDGVLVQRVVTALGFGLLVHSLYSHADPESASRS